MPDFWQEFADAWLDGFEGTPAGVQAKPVNSDMEAEVNEEAVGEPDAGT